MICTQVSDSITNTKQSPSQYDIIVLKMPTLPALKSNKSNNLDSDMNDPSYSVLNTNIMVSTGNKSMCSGITDNISRFANTNGITTDSILDFLPNLST